MSRRSRTSKSSPSESVESWLDSVIRAYSRLMRQWSALSMMTRSAHRHGWQASLQSSVDGPRLLVYPVLRTLPQNGGGTENYSDTSGSFTYTDWSFLTEMSSLDTLREQERQRLAQPTSTVPMKAPSTTSKPVTCRSGQKRSGR